MANKLGKMTTTAALALLFLYQSPVFAQEGLPQIPPGDAFPLEWVGVWRGQLDIHSAKGLQQSVPMQLHILPLEDGRYSWTIVYGPDPDAPGARRKYELLTKDRTKGHYAVDERNNIVLDAYLLGGKLFSRFEVMGSLLLATNEVVDGRMHYEIISGSLTPIATTGGGKHEGEEIPPVGSFGVAVRQYAVLVRD